MSFDELLDLTAWVESYALLIQVILRIFTEVSWSLVPNITRFGQNRILWGVFGGKNVPPKYYHR